MRQKGILLRVLSALLALTFVFGSLYVPGLIVGADDSTDGMTPAEKQAYLEQKIKETDRKLTALGNESRETEEYITTLDTKISYLQNQLNLAKETVESSKAKINALKAQYESNEAEIETLEEDIKSLTVQQEELKKEFDKSYDLYAERAKAMYISGNVNTLTAILTSSDISALLIRLEMLVRVSRCDRLLLSSLMEEGTELSETETALSSKMTTLSATQKENVKTQEALGKTVEELESQQADMSKKEAEYEKQKAESDELLKNLQAKTQQYSEFRNESQAELNEVNAEIERIAEEYIRQHTTTTTTTTTTTKKPNGTTKKTTTTTTATASNRLSLTYPVPSQTRITTGYGSAGYAGHTGVDFACPTGSNVVAAESGTVLISTDLTNADGTYRSYGRYILIAHDKKNSAGNYVFTLYAHNSQRLVSAGDYVSKGQVIAKSGSTGNSTGPHCHFEVRTPSAAYGDCVNPTNYLP